MGGLSRDRVSALDRLVVHVVATGHGCRNQSNNHVGKEIGKQADIQLGSPTHARPAYAKRYVRDAGISAGVTEIDTQAASKGPAITCYTYTVTLGLHVHTHERLRVSCVCAIIAAIRPEWRTRTVHWRADHNAYQPTWPSVRRVHRSPLASRPPPSVTVSQPPLALARMYRSAVFTILWT